MLLTSLLWVNVWFGLVWLVGYFEAVAVDGMGELISQQMPVADWINVCVSDCRHSLDANHNRNLKAYVFVDASECY